MTTTPEVAADAPLVLLSSDQAPGLVAAVRGIVPELAFDLVAPGATLKALWAAVNSGHTMRCGDTTFNPGADGGWKLIDVPIGNGLSSGMLLHPDTQLAGLSRTLRQIEKKNRRNAVERAVYVWAAADTPDRTHFPPDLVAAIRAVTPLPLKDEWAAAIWRLARDPEGSPYGGHALTDVQGCSGTLRGVHIARSLITWEGMLPAIVRAVRPRARSGVASASLASSTLSPERISV
jgi:hypothetical protein